MRKNLIRLIAASLILTACSNDITLYADDLYENFNADATVYINLNDTQFSKKTEGNVSADEISIKKTQNSAEEESADGLEIQYKGNLKLKYVLSGNYTGTLYIKNKNADAAVLLNNVSITSDKGAGPALRITSEKRTFIVVPAGTNNTIKDSRLLNQTTTIYDDKKGSVYSKGALIFTGESSTSEGGCLNIINAGYKHALYSKDYVRIANLDLNITVEGTSGRDCIRALNAVIIDGGNINLKANGTITDDESNGIRVDGEDADQDDMTVEYTSGAGFIIINGGNLTIDTVAKGITAHWKAANSVIGNAGYKEKADNSLLPQSLLKKTNASGPDPYVEINGGSISITTRGQPYEGRTDDDPSCSPEGIEAKGNLTINAGRITLNCTDDAINAGGNIVINGGEIYASSSLNDAIDANGKNGITINGGSLIAIGGNGGECAFDCDNAPLTINGGYVIGIGGGNYTAPKSGKQLTLVLSANSLGSANTSFAIVDSKDNPVFLYTLPSRSGEIAIISSPLLKTESEYSVKTGVTVKKDSGKNFYNLYTSMPEIKESANTTLTFTTSSNNLYTDPNAGRGGMRGFGGQRGAGGPAGAGGSGNFKGKRPERF